MPTKQGENWVYDPVWYCIYCSDGIIKEATKRKLGKEHIIPFGLGGNQILPRASCNKCSRITGLIELTCQHMFLGPARIRLNLPTRHREDRPSELTMVWKHRDGREEKSVVPATEYPLVIPGLKLPPPRILMGINSPGKRVAEFWVGFPNDDVHKKLTDGGPGLKIATFNNHVFCQMLAKIAHSFAAAEFGLPNFKPFLLEFILGAIETADYWIGGNMNDTSPDPAGLHRIYARRERINGIEYVIAYIKLFCLFGAPEYRVVVGEWKGSQN